MKHKCIKTAVLITGITAITMFSGCSSCSRSLKSLSSDIDGGLNRTVTTAVKSSPGLESLMFPNQRMKFTLMIRTEKELLSTAVLL